MRQGWFFLLISLVFCPGSMQAQAPAEDRSPAGSPHRQHEHHGMRIDKEGMVMNENLDQLPRDCPKITGEQTVTVHAGKRYAQQFNGLTFAYDRHEWNVAPCTKVTVTLVNEDNVRHQWMIHGLPRYLYPEGMFHLEVNGRGSKTGTFIVSSAKKTYLVHCDVAQHMEKGMKAQLKVGGGDGDLPSIPGVTSSRQADVYPVQQSIWIWGAALVAGVVGAGLIVRGLAPR